MRPTRARHGWVVFPLVALIFFLYTSTLAAEDAQQNKTNPTAQNSAPTFADFPVPHLSKRPHSYSRS